MDSFKDAIGGLTLSNKMDGNDGTNNVPHIKNKDGVVTEENTANLEMNDMRRLMETPPWVPGDEGMGYDIVYDPFILDIVIE